MAHESTYIKRVETLDWDGLWALWTAVKKRETPDWPPGKAFEYLVMRAFQLDGADVRWPYEVSGVAQAGSQEVIEQVDGAVSADGIWALVESKDTENKVNVEPIAKLRNQLLRRPSATIGLRFSVKGFTVPAQILACFLAPQTILLWGPDDVEFCLRTRHICGPLVHKYRVCVQEGRADYILTEGETQ